MKDTHSNLATSMGKRLISDTRGAGLVEYIILVGLVALVAISGFDWFGDKLHDKAHDLGDEVEQIGNE